MKDKHTIYNSKSVFKINKNQVEKLKKLASKCEKKRARLCMHSNNQDKLHEMVIAFHKDTYIRPHMHVNKSESFHIIEGVVAIFIFNNQGNIQESFKMSKYSSGDYFIYRIEPEQWHTVIPLTEYVVLHEATNGPFTGNKNSVFPDWEPCWEDKQSILEYKKRLKSIL